MSTFVRSAVRAEIDQFLNCFFDALDLRRYEIVAGSFALEGSWMRQGKLLVGPDQVMDALRSRPIDFSTAHIISNLQIETINDAKCIARFVSLVFAAHGVTEGTIPSAIPAQVARYEATIVGREGEMRISSLAATILFKN